MSNDKIISELCECFHNQQPYLGLCPQILCWFVFSKFLLLKLILISLMVVETDKHTEFLTSDLHGEELE